MVQMITNLSGSILDWHWRGEQEKFLVSWWNAVARALFYDVIDFLFVGAFLAVPIKKEHVRANTQNWNVETKE